MDKSRIRYMGGVICLASAVDQFNQGLWVSNVLDEVTFNLKAQDPTKVIQNSVERINVNFNFQVISLWKRNNLSDQDKNVTTKLEVEILDPIGSSLQKTVIDAPIPAGKKRSRYILNVASIQVTTTGEYPVQFREVFEDGSTSGILGTLVLDVVVNKS